MDNTLQLFIIPIVIDMHGHRIEIFTFVSEIHENADLVLGVQNIFELEGIINSWETCFSFLNRSIPIFPKEQFILKPKEKQFIDPLLKGTVSLLESSSCEVLSVLDLKDGFHSLHH